ncbi:putative bifunctional diguanylate cyclase/phosphodiesterase [Paraburkholderia guartelaensis]|uniref:putative bifunctional diguanylate cyclase/phosphodiesterase n=1 Tax=Paraburkholderia guartelaensis TaxID=2546446 RepID=UPI002AB76113|nr:EAL domain-containing protein [Paraburkholderia guartelaensis]
MANWMRPVGLKARLEGSTRLRFKLFGTAIALLFCIAFLGLCMELVQISAEADQIDKAWVANTRLLGETSDRLSELRLAQAYLVMSTDEGSHAVALRSSEAHRRVLGELRAQFLANELSRSLPGAGEAFASVGRYTEMVRQWESGAQSAPAFSSEFSGKTKDAYERADVAIDNLITNNAAAAHNDATRIRHSSRHLIAVVTTIGMLVLALNVWIMRRLDGALFSPLEAITRALGQLAANRHDVRMPAISHKDELGDLANAFQRFRRNADALEEAYTATKVAEEMAARLARHDALTGLPNRRYLSACIDNPSRHADEERGARYCLFVIDLDHFKPVNDLYGHAGGDLVLCTIADRLRELVGRDDVAARLGGDEFAVMARIENDAGGAGARQLAERIGDLIRMPIKIGHSEVEVGASIGVALSGRDGQDAESLLRAADAAMYRVKSRRCGGGYQFFEESMRDELRREAELEVDVRAAIGSQSIQPHYQPLVDLCSKHVYGFEILARWKRPTQGEVSPDVFIPVVERLGLMTTFTLSILKRACREAGNWPAHLSLALNISPCQLIDPLLPSQLLAVLGEESFDPNRLEIEITESALVGNLVTAKANIANFRRWGIRVSLDDFGTGYSSLHHLRELRFDKVKIDKSFVQTMLSDSESARIVDAILNLSSGLGLLALAEGIENEDIERALSKRGCAYGQGFLFGKAVAGDRVLALLSAEEGERRSSVSCLT